MPMRLKKRMKVMKDKKSNTLERITAAGGVVVDTLDKDSDHQVLLIHRRGVWDLPKGKRRRIDRGMCNTRSIRGGWS